MTSMNERHFFFFKFFLFRVQQKKSGNGLTRICCIHRIVEWPIRRDGVATYVQYLKQISPWCFSIHRRYIRVAFWLCIPQESVKRNVVLSHNEKDKISYRIPAIPLSTSWCVKWGSLPPTPYNCSAPCRNDVISSLSVRKRCWFEWGSSIRICFIWQLFHWIK